VNGVLIRTMHAAVCIDQLHAGTYLSLLMAIFIVKLVKLNSLCSVLIDAELYNSVRYET
jgi:hypothetical protein